MVPPPTALTQNAAICARKRHHAHQQRQPLLTVTPQLAYAVSSSVCCDLPSAVVHAWDQKEDDMMACNRGGEVGGGRRFEGKGGAGAAGGEKAAFCRHGLSEGGGEVHPVVVVQWKAAAAAG